jgi:hypothetical protein
MKVSGDLARPNVGHRRQDHEHEDDAAGPDQEGIGERDVDQAGHQRGDRDHPEDRWRAVALFEDRADEQDDREVAEQVIPVGVAEDVGEQAEVAAPVVELRPGREVLELGLAPEGELDDR